MTLQTTLTRVLEFFASVGYAGLILPNGWFGRPYDNLHQLTRAEVIDGDLVVELDEQLVLTFRGPAQASTSANRLRLAGFSALLWDWQEYGSLAPHHEEFVDGEVEFVAPDG